LLVFESRSYASLTRRPLEKLYYYAIGDELMVSEENRRTAH
jgi:hypothetical protein